jgi:hypothetical protein
MEWLFLTCHNNWIVCRLVRDDFLAYLVSKTHRCLFEALLSVVEDMHVERSEFTQLDIIPEDEDPGVLPEHDIDSGSEYSSSWNDEMPVDPTRIPN